MATDIFPHDVELVDATGSPIGVAGNPLETTGGGGGGGSTTITNGAGAAAVNIQDGGNSITIDGAVSVSNFPASQVVTGPLTDAQLRASAVPTSVATLPLPTGAATSTLQTAGNASLSSVDAKTLAPGQATMTASTPVVVARDQSSLPIMFDAALLSPFGDAISAALTPVVQLDFIYGINVQTGVSAIANAGVVDTNAGRLRLQSGTNVAGSALFTSRRPAKYRPGQGILARFTAAYTTGVASSTQIVGVGSSIDGYFFGYHGSSFGILHRNNSVDTWTTQSSWNGDKCDGTGTSGFNWDKTKGCVMQIKYPFLGYGDITFWVQNPTTGAWLLCHTNRYNDTSATIQLSNPNLFFYAQSVNSGNNTNLTIYSGSVGVFLCGVKSFIGSPRWAADNRKTAITTETNVLSIRNATTYNGGPNRALIRVNSLSVGSIAQTASTVRLRIDATVGGTPAFTTINGTTADNGVTITSGNSIASKDTAGTTVTGGTYVFNMALGFTGSQVLDLSLYDIIVAPGETLTISGFSNATTDFSISANWSEDI